MLRLGRPSFPIQTIDGQARALIDAVAHLGIGLAANPVFWTKQSHELNLGRAMQTLDRRLTQSIPSGVVSDQPDF